MNHPTADADSMLAACEPLHREIRGEIRRVVDLATRAKHHREHDLEACLELTRAMQELALAVRRHIAVEQRDLLPVLERLDAWGADRKRHIEEEHEREIEAVFNVDYYGSHHAMAADASSIARALVAALDREEADLRDADEARGVPDAQEAG
jgi:hypothetical protein